MKKSILFIAVFFASTHVYADDGEQLRAGFIPISDNEVRLKHQSETQENNTSYPVGWWRACKEGGNHGFCLSTEYQPSLQNLCASLGPVARYWARHNDGEMHFSTPANYTGRWRVLTKGQSNLFPFSDYVCEVVYDDGYWHSVATQTQPIDISDEKERGEDECDDAKSISPMCGNPINIINGNKFQKEVDFQHHTAELIKYERYYNSLSGQFVEEKIGENWSDNFSDRLIVGNDFIYVIQSSGKLVNYSLNAESGSFYPKGSKFTYIKPYNGNYLLVNRDGSEHLYNNHGQILNKKLQNGEYHL